MFSKSQNDRILVDLRGCVERPSGPLDRLVRLLMQVSALVLKGEELQDHFLLGLPLSVSFGHIDSRGFISSVQGK